MHSNLPHLNLEENYQFITFRTHDSIDTFIEKIDATHNISTKQKEYAIDTHLDNSTKGAYLNNEIIELIKTLLCAENNKLYELEIVAIMPNHLHILLKQLYPLDKIMKYIKGVSAIQINKKLNKQGTFWQKGYFDKAIRDEKHYQVVYEYIQNNPIKANLKDWQSRRCDFSRILQ